MYRYHAPPGLRRAADRARDIDPGSPCVTIGLSARHALALPLCALLLAAAACSSSNNNNAAKNTANSNSAATAPSVAATQIGAATPIATQKATTPSAATPVAATSPRAIPAGATPTPFAVDTSKAPKLPATITGSDGKQVTVTDVSRIVPLNGDLTEIVYALGLGKNVVGDDFTATYPLEAQKLPKIGLQTMLSAEGILALKPTVIIGNNDAGPSAVLDQIRSAGIPLVILQYPSTLDGVAPKIKQVAQALGVPDRGDALGAHTQTQIDAAEALAKKATSHPRVAFLYLRGTQVQDIGGKDYGSDGLIVAANAIDAGAQAGVTGLQPLTAEALVAANPDVILTLDGALDSVGGVDGLLKLPGVGQTPAGMNKKIIHFDDQYLLGLGPRVGEALMDLVKALHPELAQGG
jgi:iron complex transport system substrate-binding protein